MTRFLIALVPLLLITTKGEELSISSDLMQDVVYAAELSRLVIRDDIAENTAHYQTEYPMDYITAWCDHPDATLVAMEADRGVCYAVFRSTCEDKYVQSADSDSSWLPDWANYEMAPDWQQNMNPGLGRVNGCTVRKGYFDGLYNSYFSDFDAAVKSCMSDCPGCRLVLSGHSQGGAIAVVASILYAKYNPTVITFGAPKAVYMDLPIGLETLFPYFKPCYRINSSMHYRFSNRIIVSDWRQRDFVAYDVVPQLSGAGATHVGHSILLSESSYSAAYLGLDESSTRLEWSDDAHKLGLYIERVHKLQQKQRWSGKDETKFAGLFNGAQCVSYDECASGRCDGVWDRKCTAKLAKGTSCNESNDCQSGYCNWWWKCT